MKRIFKVLMLSIMAFVLVACTADKDSGETVKLGLNMDSSGGGADYGQVEVEGAKLAVKQFNEKGGFNGKEVELVIYDNKTDEQEAYRLQTVLAEAGVFAIIGATTSGTSAMAIKASGEQGVPTISPSATADATTNDGVKGYDFGYRICFADSYQGIVMVNFALQKDFKNIAILADNSSSYAQGLAKTFKETLVQKGGTIVHEEYYSKGAEDFNVFWTNIKAMDNVDAVFIPGYFSEVGLIIRQARANGVDLPILGVDGYESTQLISIAGAKALNNVFYSNHYSNTYSSAEHQAFVKAYEAEYGRKPNAFGALAFDAANLALDALVRAGEADPKKVNEAIKATVDFIGVTGSTSIDELHNAQKSAYIIELVDGVEANAVLVNP